MTCHELQNIDKGPWLRDKVWHLSNFTKQIMEKAKRRYPKQTTCEKSAWPSDEQGVAQNMTYLFAGHSLKVSKAFCQLFGDGDSLSFLTRASSIRVVDLACGPGMASITTLDFLLQLIKARVIRRETPLNISFILNDLKKACLDSAVDNLNEARNLLSSDTPLLRVGEVKTFHGSILTILPFLQAESQEFELLCFSNAFDHVLIYGEEALKEDPHCADPIALARPCDRPALLADFLLRLGNYANPYFSRVFLMQEWRHSPLMPVALPSRDLKVIRARMIQRIYRPDISGDSMSVRFCYCGCRYGFSIQSGKHAIQMHPLATLDDLGNYFSEIHSSQSDVAYLEFQSSPLM